MRYVRKEMIITDVCDEEVKDIEIIKSLFESMLKDQSDASVIYYNKEGEVPLTYERVRIVSVNQDSVDMQIFRGGSLLRAKGVQFKNFVEVKVVSTTLDKHLKRNNGDRLRYLDTT